MVKVMVKDREQNTQHVQTVGAGVGRRKFDVILDSLLSLLNRGQFEVIKILGHRLRSRHYKTLTAVSGRNLYLISNLNLAALTLTMLSRYIQKKTTISHQKKMNKNLSRKSKLLTPKSQAM